MDELDDAVKKAQAELDEARERLADAKRRLAPAGDLAATARETLKRAEAVEAEADDLAVTLERHEDHERRLREELAYLLGEKS